MARASTNEGSIQAVTRTMRIIELLAESTSGMTVFEIADALGAEKSIASRLLSSLHSEDYVARDANSDRYLLSLKLLRLSLKYERQIGFPSTCLPSLGKLRDDTGELVQLAAIDGARFAFVAFLESPRPLSIRPARYGNVLLHSTAAGKAWLATLPDEDAVRLVLNQGLTSPTTKTKTKVEDVLSELARARARGYGISIEETMEGVSSVGVAIGQKRFGYAVGAVIIAAPTTRLAPDTFDDVAARLHQTATELEEVWPTSMGIIAKDFGRDTVRRRQMQAV